MFAGGEDYERYMGRWSRKLAPELLAFARVAEGNVVLDVGCGTGALTVAAGAISGVRATGVDPSASYVESAQRNATARVSFETGDAMALPFPDKTFDRVLSQLVLNFVPDPAAALGEMIRVSRSNGIVAAAVWDYGDGMEMLRTFWDVAAALDPAAPDEGRMPLCRRGELAALWRTSGLRDVEDAPLSIDMHFASFDDYWQPFQLRQGPGGAYTASLSESGQDALRSGLRNRLGDQNFTLRARAWAVRGVVI